MVTRSEGWELADYEWDPDTGIGTFTYERTHIDTGVVETKVLKKAQPHDTKHVGWYTRV